MQNKRIKAIGIAILVLIFMSVDTVLIKLTFTNVSLIFTPFSVSQIMPRYKAQRYDEYLCARFCRNAIRSLAINGKSCYTHSNFD